MSPHDPDQINRLIGEFTDLHEHWEKDPAAFDWSALQALARAGADAYNEGAGPSFQSLAIDGAAHGEFHERFLSYSLQAGFDPFRLVHPGSTSTMLPAIDHGGLAQDAQSNPCSARMRARLMELARSRFQPLVDNTAAGHRAAAGRDFEVIEACAESIPLDLLERIAPELIEAHPDSAKGQAVDPVEPYLSSAEVIVEVSSRPYG